MENYSSLAGNDFFENLPLPIPQQQKVVEETDLVYQNSVRKYEDELLQILFIVYLLVIGYLYFV